MTTKRRKSSTKSAIDRRAVTPSDAGRVLARLAGASGGHARAAALSPAERSAQASRAATARWAARGPRPTADDDEIESEGGGRAPAPRATHAGTLRIGATEIPCAVLSDGRRVLTQQGFIRAIGRAGPSPRRADDEEVNNLPRFLTAANLKPFISEELRCATRPVHFRSVAGGGAGGRATGYPAELLPRVCEVFLTARDAGALSETQVHVARACDALIRGLATVGIVALIDEATGYQQDRDAAALHAILEHYVSKELLPWTRRFPPEFYKQMFRLKGWTLDAANPSRGPRYAGKLTNYLVYDRLPPGVRAELERQNPVVEERRLHKHHQWLTPSAGHPALDRQIDRVTLLMTTARTWAEFVEFAGRSLPPRTVVDGEDDPQGRLDGVL